MHIKETLVSLLMLKGLYLHAFAPVVGVASFIKHKEISPVCYPLLFLVVIGLFDSVLTYSVSSSVRLFQFAGIILFFSALLGSDLKFENIAKLILLYGCAYVFYDLMCGTSLFQKEMFGVRLPRFRGMLREYNFSAAAYLLSFVIFLAKRKWFLSILSVALILSTGSRAGILSVAVAIAFYVLEEKGSSLRLLMLLFLMYPMIIFGTFFVDKNRLAKIHHLSSRRLGIQRDVLKIVRRNPFGVGYFKGRDVLASRKTQSDLPFTSTEAHNLPMQVLLEFGFIGYLSFSIFLLLCSFRIKTVYPVAAMFTMFSFLNGLHEIPFYLAIAFSVRDLGGSQPRNPAVSF